MSLWEVEHKTGDIPYEPFDPIKDADDLEFEVSVIRKDNEHGHVSWGWPGDNKIIIGVGSLKFALKAAHQLCSALNEGVS